MCFGGAVRTEELTLPGFRHDTFSSVYPAGAASPVFGRMPLDRHGPPRIGAFEGLGGTLFARAHLASLWCTHLEIFEAHDFWLAQLVNANDSGHRCFPLIPSSFVARTLEDRLAARKAGADARHEQAGDDPCPDQ